MSKVVDLKEDKKSLSEQEKKERTSAILNYIIRKINQQSA